MFGIAYAMGQPPTGAEGARPGASFIGMLPPLIAMFAIFYFLLIRPQQKKQKEHDSMLSSLKEGNNVLTTGGLYGIVKKIKEDVVTLQIADNVRVKVSRSSISSVKNKV